MVPDGSGGWDPFIRDRLSGVPRAQVKTLCAAFVAVGFLSVPHFKALCPKEWLGGRAEWDMLSDVLFDKV